MDGFVIAPLRNSIQTDATGAFHVGVRRITEIHKLSRQPILFENHGPAKSVYEGFSKHIDDARGGWDFFAYFGHGEPWGMVSANISSRAGAMELAQRIMRKANRGLVVMLYACNCGAPGGFASWLADALSPINATVYAHLPPKGHTFMNANVVSYPGGDWVIPTGHPLWGQWYRDMHNELDGDLWARFPFMTQMELEAELEAPDLLLGRWKVGDKVDSWDTIFFGDKTVVATRPTNRNAVIAQGTWTATRYGLTVKWQDRSIEEWPLPLSLRNQNVSYATGKETRWLKATRTETIDHNPQSLFRGLAARSKPSDV
jgi:hypothetical protein